MIEEQLKKVSKAIDVSKQQECKIEETLAQAKKDLDDGLARAEWLVSERNCLKTMATSTQRIADELELAEQSQKTEYKVLSTILQNPCPVLTPTFIPTASGADSQHIEASSCAVCCFGFRCYNLIPASCGHCYHPSCIFSLIGGSRKEPRFIACGVLFSNEWLACWGLLTVQENSTVIHNDPLLTVFGTQSVHLVKRRNYHKKNILKVG